MRTCYCTGSHHPPAMDMETRILVVDDDPGIRDLIGAFLQRHGFRVRTAGDATAMRAALAAEPAELVVLDVMMPREDGLTALRQIGANGPAVILLSAMGSEIDRIVGLEMGADDYLAKPCNPRELLARIRAVLRRRAAVTATADVPALLRFEGWALDPAARTLADPGGTAVTLTDGEFRLLITFCEHPRRVLGRDLLLDHARGMDSDQFDRAIDVQISRLRRKLARDGAAELIRTVRNEGYLFVPAVMRG